MTWVEAPPDARHDISVRMGMGRAVKSLAEALLGKGVVACSWQMVTILGGERIFPAVDPELQSFGGRGLLLIGPVYRD
jgi:hypothetical protein